MNQVSNELPCEVEPIERAEARFLRALDRVWAINPKDPTGDNPIRHRLHVFDLCVDGHRVRLIAFRFFYATRPPEEQFIQLVFYLPRESGSPVIDVRTLTLFSRILRALVKLHGILEAEVVASGDLTSMQIRFDHWQKLLASAAAPNN